MSVFSTASIEALAEAEEAARFWSNVRKGHGDQCWVWAAGTMGRGYGHVRIGGVDTSAHRLSWTITFGQIQPGLCVCHRCDNPPCIRPDHLFLGTQGENQRDASRKRRLVGNRYAFGELSARAKLTESEVLQIRAASGRQVDIAAAFGVNQQHVSSIKRGVRCWQHLTDGRVRASRPTKKTAEDRTSEGYLARKAAANAARFWAKVSKPDGDGCWEWTARRGYNGYGQFSLDGRHCLAHRFSWFLLTGHFPEGLLVLHKCDNRACVRPGHLSVGNSSDNMQDTIRKGRMRPRRGDASPGAKLTSQAVVDICADPRPHRTIAADYGVSSSLVGLLKSGNRWRHLPRLISQI